MKSKTRPGERSEFVAKEVAYLKHVLGGAAKQWIAFAKTQPWEKVQERSRYLAARIQAMGADVEYDNVEVLNSIAQAIALAAFLPGGVTYYGMHFEERHPECPSYGSVTLVSV